MAIVLTATSLAAQQPSVAETTLSDTRQASNGQKDWHFLGHVEMARGDIKIYADDVKFTSDDHRALATGNVVFAQGNNRISAERADFNVDTRLGTFYSATGMADIQPARQPARQGAAAIPQMPGQETTVIFFGDTVEKIGPRKYRITNGGFTTCVQPTPRWDLHADTVVLNIDHYTVLRQAVLNVKGVPLFYLPVMYYPTKKENRATGFLLPTYGISTIRGQSLHNAFFWAIDRSEDLTFTHDWFSKTGQGVGSEYRYNFGGGSDGNLRGFYLDQKATNYALADGTFSTLAASRSSEIRGSANQTLPGGLRARARVDYFSDITTMQTFNTNIADASRSQRTVGSNVVGGWGSYTLAGTLDRTESFYNQTNSAVTGSWPRVALTRNERPIPGTPLYFSVGSEYARLLRDNRTEIVEPDQSLTTIETDQSLTRLDLTPQIRFPFRKWQWFTVNSTLGWRDTYYTRSLDQNLTVVDEGVNRRFVQAQAQFTGPTFVRVWETPDSGYAERFKHSIEPSLTVTRTSSIDNSARIVQLDTSDFIVGNVTQYAYGVTNRLYAKRRATAGQTSQAREIANVELTQTYYTDQRAGQFDPRYASSFSGAAQNNFSPIALTVRAMPIDAVNASLRAEFDSQYHALRTITATGSYTWSGLGQTTVGWSKRAFIDGLSGFNDPNLLDHYINTSSTLHTRDNRYGGVYSLNYDARHATVLQQRISAFYNSQCCGIALEYQTYNFAGGLTGSLVPADHRFFVSFSLAGLGNFSPLNGALSSVPR
jgi:LPS-assembly protein